MSKPEKLKWPDDLDLVVRRIMNVLKSEGVTGIGIDSLFSAVCLEVGKMDKNPQGTNAGWVVKDTLRKLVSKGTWPIAILPP